MIIYKHIKKIYFLLIVLFQACSFEDEEIMYEQNLVVFATITANLPVIDTVFISKTASLDEDVLSENLWVEDAEVILVKINNDSTDGEILEYKDLGDGKYFPISNTSSSEDYINYRNYIIEPGTTYKLIVNSESDSLLAYTRVPGSMNIRPHDVDDYVCPDGTVKPVKTINVNNLDNLSLEEFSSLLENPVEYITENSIIVDSVTYRFGDCYTKSFASYPMFGVDFDTIHQTIKILTYALEAEKEGWEPLDTLSNTLDADSGGFFDYNYNGERDSSIFVNLIYDTTLGFRIWKGRYPRTENNTPYRINPWQWNIEETPTTMMWLYFDYYGYQVVTFQATSESYFNYFSGDPVGRNIYLLPDSNLDGGFGVFYSSNASRFLVYIKRDDGTDDGT